MTTEYDFNYMSMIIMKELNLSEAYDIKPIIKIVSYDTSKYNTKVIDELNKQQYNWINVPDPVSLSTNESIKEIERNKKLIYEWTVDNHQLGSGLDFKSITGGWLKPPINKVLGFSPVRINCMVIKSNSYNLLLDISNEHHHKENMYYVEDKVTLLPIFEFKKLWLSTYSLHLSKKKVMRNLYDDIVIDEDNHIFQDYEFGGFIRKKITQGTNKGWLFDDCSIINKSPTLFVLMKYVNNNNMEICVIYDHQLICVKLYQTHDVNNLSTWKITWKKGV